MKIKSVTLYDVTILLNNNTTMYCMLCTPPTVEALTARAKAEDAPREIIEALAFFREINLPAKGKDEAITEITIAGTIVGAIKVVPLFCVFTRL